MRDSTDICIARNEDELWRDVQRLLGGDPVAVFVLG
jgi:hypothetical protein